jgi:uncharacterized protein (UPF0333 family)
MRDKKGQAAMEFLMTYGWAILAAIIVIGILGYYYFNSNVLTPRTGVLTPPFYLNAWTVDTTGINLEIKNNGGETLNMTNVSVSIAGCVANTTGIPLSQGEMKVVILNCTSFVAGDKVDGEIKVVYTKTGSSLALTSTGSVKDIVA